MEPVPETLWALRCLHPGDESDAMVDLERATARVRELVPTCVGVSITEADTGVALTFVEPSSVLAGLEPLGFLARAEAYPDEPADPPADSPAARRADPTDEQAWRQAAVAQAPPGVRTSLSIPLLDGDLVIGAVTFYAEAAQAFDDRREVLAALFGAWAPGAVTNDDLAFSSRLRAAVTPSILAEHADLDRATEPASAALGLSVQEARTRLRSASTMAGVSEVDVARAVLAAGDQVP